MSPDVDWVVMPAQVGIGELPQAEGLERSLCRIVRHAASHCGPLQLKMSDPGLKFIWMDGRHKTVGYLL